MRRIAWLAPWLLMLLAGCGGHVLPEIRSNTDRLTVARRMYADREYADAIELLKAYTASSGGAADVDGAIYLLGQCYLATRDWALAAIEFERLLKDYPESDSSGSASFRLGEAFFGQSRTPDFDQEFTIKAVDQWRDYQSAYPGHWLQGEAQTKLLQARSRLAKKMVSTGNLYVKLKLPEPARVYFQRTLDEYSDTPVAVDAQLGLALADAREGKRDQAIARLREIEVTHKGKPVAQRAANERRRIEHHKKR